MPSLIDVPDDLLPVQGLVARALERVDKCIEDALASDLPPVRQLCEHVEQYRGKMVRPTLVALCGLASRAAGAPSDDRAITDDHIKVAAVCEMIHLATLVHDDVLDEADQRRRTTTVNSLHGNETAVILGDYLFSSAYRLCSTLDSQDAALLIGTTGMTLCTGELLQLYHRGDFSLDERTYFEIVRRKTASLIATACRLGASRTLLATGADGALPDAVARLEQYGLDIGVAFQIQDDLLDLTGDQQVVGKSLGKDVEKGKLTLPMIHHLRTADPVRRGRSLLLVEDDTLSPIVRTRGLVEAMASTGSIDHARRAAEDLVRRAQQSIAPLPDSAAKRLLMLMADSVVARAY